MEQKFKETLRALIRGTGSYKLTWRYLSDGYYDEVEAFYTRQIETDEGVVSMAFDSAFETHYKALLMIVTCSDLTDEEDSDIGEFYELRIFKLGEENELQLESPILIYESTDSLYEDDLKNLYAHAAASASGVDKIMDELIRELGE